MSKKILVAMSGGVDSSVAAYLLKEAGWTVGGATIRTWASGECKDINTKTCCGVIGAEDARDVADKLGIPHYVFNFENEFKENVVDYFSAEYLKGRTPNPCIACNQHIKFKLFLDRARELGYDYIATGHYARLTNDAESGRRLIREGLDSHKDQSYVLFPLSQDILNHLELPVGEYSKPAIRGIARNIGLKVADKPDSQEICFIPSNDYGAFLEREQNLQPRPGDIRDHFGNTLGTHQGFYHYTVGQRKGLRIPFKHALYVTDIHPEENVIVVGDKDEVKNTVCYVRRINWFRNVHSGEKLPVHAKIRSRHAKAAAVLECLNASDAVVTFHKPQEAITPGQACVFYAGDFLIGGGWIDLLPAHMSEDLPRELSTEARS